MCRPPPTPLLDAVLPLVAIIAGLVQLPRAFFNILPRDPTLCRACRYSLAGLHDPIRCPECGRYASHRPPAPAPAPRLRTRNLAAMAAITAGTVAAESLYAGLMGDVWTALYLNEGWPQRIANQYGGGPGPPSFFTSLITLFVCLACARLRTAAPLRRVALTLALGWAVIVAVVALRWIRGDISYPDSDTWSTPWCIAVLLAHLLTTAKDPTGAA